MSCFTKVGSGTLFVILFITITAANGQNFPTPANQVKAVFLFNFTQFTEWNGNSFTSENAPLIIGILGNDPFGAYLDETVAGEKISGHPLLVQRYRSIDDIGTCHILFISNHAAEPISEILDAIKDKSILTVSDADNFTKYGGMIHFFMKNRKIRFEINAAAAKAAGITFSSKLMRVAEIYNPSKR